MRARLVCHTNMTIDELKSALVQLHLWPEMDQEHPDLKARQTEILASGVSSDIPLVNETLVGTIYESHTQTWGVINRPAGGRYVLRLQHPDAQALRRAAETVVVGLKQVTHGRHRVQFPEPFEVQEPNTASTAFWGHVLPRGRWALALKERPTEAFIGALTLVMSVILLTASSPWGGAILVPLVPDPHWHTWLDGLLDRFASATLMTGALSWAEVLFHWLAVRRLPNIRWELH
ncbi:MAG: hypothetical protein H7338_20360 [Candidatus Sericytochromatia bacterium]|nr:hypothetical protein [Candidatus Sericytochromatia bacterium]